MQRTLSICPIEEKTISKTMTNSIDEHQSEILKNIHLYEISPKSEEGYYHIALSQDLLKTHVQDFLKGLMDGDISLPQIRDFEDKEYQTLVKDNSLKSNKPKIISMSEAISNLRRSVELVKKEEEEFNKEEYEKLEEISLYDIDD